MTFSFNPHRGLILLDAKIYGPAGEIVLRLALDTGANTTTLNRQLLEGIGYQPALSTVNARLTTASGVETVPLIELDRLEVLGQVRTAHSVVCHSLPPSSRIDGVLGLDFFRGQKLVLDFHSGDITLE